MRQLKIIATADLHIEQIIQHEFDMVYKHLRYIEDVLDHEKPDIFCILGDYIHKSTIQAESQEYLIAVQFLSRLSNICQSRSIQFLMIRGTLSHDGEVVSNMLKMNANLGMNIKYFDTIRIVKHNGYSILLLPEVTYPTHDAFIDAIKAVVKEPVDIILYHNMLDFAIPFLKQINSNYNLGRSVVINSKELQNYFKIMALGGHVHDDLSYENIYYTGQIINERGKLSKPSNRYGLRLVEFKDDTYNIKTIPNPNYIETIQCILDLNQQSFDLILNTSREFDIEKTLFILKNFPRTSPHILEFKKVIKPKYLKILPMEEINTQTTIIQKDINSNLLTSTDSLFNMLLDIHKKKYMKSIPEEVINEIKTYNKE